MKKLVFLVTSILFVGVVFSAPQVPDFSFYPKEFIKKNRVSICLSTKISVFDFRKSAGFDFSVTDSITIDGGFIKRGKKFKSEYFLIIEPMEKYSEAFIESSLIRNDLVQFFSFGKDNGNSDLYFLTNQVLVKISRPYQESGKTIEDLEQNFDVIGENPFMANWLTVRIHKGQMERTMVAFKKLVQDGFITEFEVEKMGVFYFQDASTNNCNPTDPLFQNQWYLRNQGQNGGTIGVDIKACDAWEENVGLPGITTAIFDQGIELNHPDLAANLISSSYDANTNSSPSTIYGNHGTACAGIVAAVNNEIGVVGVAPGTKLISISTALGPSTTNQMLANAFNWVVSNGVSVISNSWGGGESSSILNDAISNALTNGRGGLGTVVVFAAGNNNSSSSNYPGNSNQAIINVGAIDRCGIRSGRVDVISNSCEPWCSECQPASAFGSTLDIVAGGTSIATTDRTGSNGYNPSGDYHLNFGGTSAACPMVAGVAALVLSSNPCLTRQMVHDIICRSGQKLNNYTFNFTQNRPVRLGTWNQEVGHGLVDAKKALEYSTNMYLQNKQENTPTVHSYNRIYAGEFVNPDEAYGEYLISSNVTVDIKAKQSIHFKSGFKAQLGSNFRGFIDPNNCNPTNPFARMAFALNDPRDDEAHFKQTHRQLSSRSFSFDIFPNPASSKLSIALNNVYLGTFLVEIVDLIGKVQHSGSFNKNNSGSNFDLDINALLPGIYFLRIKIDGVMSSRKFIKE